MLVIILLDYGSSVYVLLIFKEPFIFAGRFFIFSYLFFSFDSLIVLEVGLFIVYAFSGNLSSPNPN